MRIRFIGGAIATAIAAIAIVSAGTQARVSGQTATAPVIPRTAEGRPDLSGIWQAMNAAAWNIQDHEAQKDVPAGLGVVDGNEIPYQPWAAARQRENFANRATADPEGKCYLPGVPRITYMPYPFQIVQTPTNVDLLYEYVHAIRNVYIDGSAHPAGHIDWWMGDSRGRWEGDTLVVDVVHFNDETWFDRAGNFHSDALHVVERYTLVDRITSIRSDHRGSQGVHPAVEDDDAALPAAEKNIQLLEYQCYAFDGKEFHVIAS